ncbi:RNA-directed DNA polymerase, eukaryota, reverse transcriptase zinc-binding domain protein [Tanacetum coccineum]
MRSKRTIKPTRFFDNSVVSTSRNANKQKTGSKKSVTKEDKMNSTVQHDDSQVTSKGGVRNDETEPVENNGKPNNVAGDVIGKEHDVVNVSKDVENNGRRSKEMAKEQNERCKTDSTNGKRTYANVGIDKQDFYRKLFAKPTEVDKEGNVFVVFDDKIMSEGCKKWDKMMELILWREPKQVPLWVRLCNVPLEAWSTNGISALASRLGNPLVMDSTTAEMYKVGIGRFGYARVLVEVDANKILPDVPPRCATCYVFGHNEHSCIKNEVLKKLNRDVDDESLKNKGSSSNDADGFTEVVNRKNKGYGDKNSNNQTQNYGFYGQKKKPMAQFVYQKKNKAVLRKEKEDTQQNVRVPDGRTDQREPINDSINSVNTSC